MDHEIILKQKGGGDAGFAFEVSVSGHKFDVTVAKDYWQALTGGKITPEDLVKKSFAFLLEREGPESILPEFDLPLIGHYFPEYEETMRRLV